MDEVRSLSRFDLLEFVYLTMLMSGASSIAGNDFVRLIFMGIGMIYAIVRYRPLFNGVLLGLFFAWVLINVIASLYLEADIDYIPFIGKMVLLYTAYLLLVCGGKNFWDKYESFLYKLVKISFVIYLFSLLFPSLFDLMVNVFRPFTEESFYQKETQQNYFYSFFFTYIGGDKFYRNCGFMWEPGAYAMLLNLLIVYNIAKHGFQLNKHIKLYFLVLLTTFSTAGYVAMFLVLIFYLFEGRNVYGKIFAILSVFVLFVWFLNSDFLLPKIERFLEATVNGEVSHQGYRDFYEANRVYSFVLLFNKFLMFPMGWGCVHDTVSYLYVNDILTVNGLGNLLVTWGGFVFLFFMYAIAKFFYQVHGAFRDAILGLLVMAIAFFSNPIENNVLLYILILSPFVVCHKSKKIVI